MIHKTLTKNKSPIAGTTGPLCCAQGVVLFCILDLGKEMAQQTKALAKMPDRLEFSSYTVYYDL